MANTITNIMPKILARGLLALREQATMCRVVNMDYGAEARQKGQTIDIPIASETAAYDITPAPTHSSAPDSAPGLVQIQLNNWKGAGFFLNDNEMAQIDRSEHFIPLQMSEAIRSLANVINEDVFAEYTGIYGYTGTAATTPFASTVEAATNARKVLHQQRAPRMDRRGVLDYDAEANALALSPFSDADKIGTSDIRVEGEIGRKYGIDWYADDAVPTHANGTAWALGVVVASTTAAAGTSIDLTASASGDIHAGDVFTIAGQTQTYVATASTAAGTSHAVSIQPPLTSIATAAAACTAKADHVVNMAFHRDAFALAMRPLVGVTATNPNIMSATDPMTGISLRLELSRQYKQDRWEYDVLWGSKLVRAALATRIAG